MIDSLTNQQFILSVLRDGKPHYSREFVQDEEGNVRLLEYRKRLSELRQKGFNIQSIKVNGRPAYILRSLPGDLFGVTA